MNLQTRTNAFEETPFDPEELANQRKSDSIFISIVAENEDVYKTIESLYNNARYPNNIFVSCTIGVVGHSYSLFTETHQSPIDHPNLKVTIVPVSIVSVEGGKEDYVYDTYGKLRQLTDSNYNNETYFMNIGSDMRFDPDWDIVLMKQYQSLSELDSKFILTGFPRAFLPHDNETEGFKFYMNHKEMTTLQREEYDGGRYPASGIMERSNMQKFQASTEGIQHDEELDESDDEELDESDDDDEMMESYQDEDEMMESDDEDEEELDEDEDEESIDETYNHKRAVREGKSTVKPKGVGIGSGPKFTYKNKAAGGFKEDKKEGPKSVGTGKAKFEYKKGANMEGKSKVVKAETKENYGSKKHEFKRKKVDGVEKKAGTKDGHYKDYEKTETKEAARTYGFGSKEGRGLRKGITNNRNYVYGKNGVKVESTEAEVSMLREKNEEYRKALNIFREKLNEVAIFNSNLAYATRLFTEHSTTKKEKINILRRFDGVETLKESKNLYKSIKDELSNGDTQSITESVETKLNKQVSTGSSVNLIESKTYENPQFLRIKDLMSKL